MCVTAAGIDGENAVIEGRCEACEEACAGAYFCT